MRNSARNMLLLGSVALAHAGMVGLLGLARPADQPPSERPAIGAVLVGFTDIDGALSDLPIVALPSPAPAETPPPVEQAEPAPTQDLVELAVHAVLAADQIRLATLDLPPTELQEVFEPTSVVGRSLEPTPSSAAQACEIAAALQDALQQNEMVRAAIARVPRSSRSVADAIMLWDGSWRDDEFTGEPTVFEPIRGAILEAVRNASVECRDQPVRGPRFMAVNMGPSTTVLAVGSGVWRWADLIESARLPSGALPVTANVRR
jgi:hypothetical protein